MWNIMEMFALEFHLDMNIIKNIVKKVKTNIYLIKLFGIFP